jgi:3-oxoacyl-[acyl-carrier-protein] synthase III
MRLDATSLIVPSRVLTNEAVVALVREHSAAHLGSRTDRTLRAIELLLKRSGARERHWLDDDERPLELIERAVHQALGSAGLSISDVDLLVYSGIDRGFLEPATAYFVANALGMDDVECFDVVDACNGWLRSTQIVQHALASGAYRRALVINAEFPMLAGGAVYPALFTLESPDYERAFAAYTLGEGVTATLLSADEACPWAFRFASRPRYADLCTVPLPGFERFSRPSERLRPDGVNRFSADSRAMFAVAAVELPALFLALDVPLETVRLIVPHAATRRAVEDGAELLGVRDLVEYVYPDYGNLASASLPAGIATAVGGGRLQRGDRVVVCSASAGMAFGVASFVY